MSQPTVPPLMMFRSFLTVASGYIGQSMIWIGLTFAIGTLFFPEFVEFSNLDDASQQRIMEVDPGSVIPPVMFWAVACLTSLGTVGVGWLVFKTAPFAQFPHAVFVAVLLFISQLQFLVADPPAKKAMTLVYMIAFPIAVIVGARIARGRVVSDDESDRPNEGVN